MSIAEFWRKSCHACTAAAVCYALLPVSMVLTAGSGSVFAQATPTPPPGGTPAVFDGKRPTKEDKSRMRDLKGHVEDDGGSPIDGAIVQIKNLKTGRTIDFITKPDGAYVFHDLDMDIDYQLTAKRDGYGDPVSKKLSKYDSRKPAILNFELQRKGKKQAG